jgi:general secretion pathway protein B
MSYILDALKRADAERGRGQVPGLNAQPLGASPEPSGSRRSRSAMPLLALVGGGRAGRGGCRVLVLAGTRPGGGSACAR